MDLRETLRWSLGRFGRNAALCDETLIVQALRDIQSDSELAGSVVRPEFGVIGARTYPVRLSRDRAHTSLGVLGDPRHFVLYRHLEHERAIDTGRILHDGRDLARHVPDC